MCQGALEKPRDDGAAKGEISFTGRGGRKGQSQVEEGWVEIREIRSEASGEHWMEKFPCRFNLFSTREIGLAASFPQFFWIMCHQSERFSGVTIGQLGGFKR